MDPDARSAGLRASVENSAPWLTLVVVLVFVLDFTRFVEDEERQEFGVR
jgi:hypothetical protein